MRTFTRLAAGFSAALLLSPAAWAQSPSAAGSPTPVASTPAPDLGVALLSAVVRGQDGVLVRGEGATTILHEGVGSFYVNFVRNVTNCTYYATIGAVDSAYESPGVISVASSNLGANGVYVQTRQVNGGFIDRSFHLSVFCGR